MHCRCAAQIDICFSGTVIYRLELAFLHCVAYNAISRPGCRKISTARICWPSGLPSRGHMNSAGRGHTGMRVRIAPCTLPPLGVCPQMVLRLLQHAPAALSLQTHIDVLQRCQEEREGLDKQSGCMQMRTMSQGCARACSAVSLLDGSTTSRRACTAWQQKKHKPFRHIIMYRRTEQIERDAPQDLWQTPIYRPRSGRQHRTCHF